MSKKVRLTGQQLKAIEALLEGKSVTDAAEFAGVTRQTVHAWLNTSAFTQAIEQGQREIMRAAVRRLTAMLDRSVSEVNRLVEGAEDEPTRLRAALAVPAMMQSLKEHADIVQQLQEIEAVLGTKNEHSKS